MEIKKKFELNLNLGNITVLFLLCRTFQKGRARVPWHSDHLPVITMELAGGVV